LTEETKQATPSATEEVQEDAQVAVADQPQGEPEAEAPATTAEVADADAPPATAAMTEPEFPATEPADAAPAEPAASNDQPITAETADARAPEASVTSTADESDAPASETAAESATAPVEPEAVTATEGPAATAEAETAEASAEPMTMAELLDHPDNEVKSLKHGDVVEGTVVRVDPDEILVDFGGKSEGVVSNRELLNRRGPRDGEETKPEIQVGSEVLVYVLQPESPEGHAVLSLRRAGLERKWRAMQERFDAGEIVEARVIDHNKGGLIVDLGVRGFVPISQIVDFPRRPRDEQPRDAAQEIAEKLQPFVGRTLRLKILEVNRKANRLILGEGGPVRGAAREARRALQQPRDRAARDGRGPLDRPVRGLRRPWGHRRPGPQERAFLEQGQQPGDRLQHR
jgi:DNA-directed RNA polymerase subunit E'/Rpb7